MYSSVDQVWPSFAWTSIAWRQTVKILRLGSTWTTKPRLLSIANIFANIVGLWGGFGSLVLCHFIKNGLNFLQSQLSNNELSPDQTILPVRSLHRHTAKNQSFIYFSARYSCCCLLPDIAVDKLQKLSVFCRRQPLSTGPTGRWGSVPRHHVVAVELIASSLVKWRSHTVVACIQYTSHHATVTSSVDI